MITKKYSRVQARSGEAALRASHLDTQCCRLGGEDSPLACVVRALMHLAVKRGYDPMKVVQVAIEDWACDITDPSEDCLMSEASCKIVVQVQKYDADEPGHLILSGDKTRRVQASKHF
jgi:hypothetical protein